jgi:hypothetical protein
MKKWVDVGLDNMARVLLNAVYLNLQKETKKNNILLEVYPKNFRCVYENHMLMGI